MWIRLALFLAFAIPISAIDLRTGRIPDALSLTGAAVIALYLATFDRLSFLPGVYGAGACFALLWLIRFATHGLGFGDVKFALPIGFACGPTLAFFALVFASATALSVAIPLLALGKIERKTKLPFGPFLAFGAALVLLLGALGIIAP